MLLLLSAFALSSSPAPAPALSSCDQEVGRVVIVGAGFAGLTAAHALQKHGCTQVTILESRDRIGGRAYTLGPEYGPLAGIDVGAHWVVAGKHNINMWASINM